MSAIAKLRDYQSSAIEATKEMMRSGVRRVMLYAPTGAGKSVISAAIIESAASRGKRVVWICNRIGLVQQSIDHLKAAGISCGVLQGGNSHGSHMQVLVASIQTLESRGTPDADLYVIDEGHFCATSKTFLKIVRERKDAPMVSFSATPFSKGLGRHYEFGPLFGGMVVAATIPELIERGYLVDVDIYAPSEPDLSSVPIVAGDYNEEQLGEAVDKPALVGDIVDHWFRLAKNRPTVCFATNIAHSQHICNEFMKAGVRAEHIDCYNSEEERKQIMARVLSGETKVISNVAILAEGWDFPACKVMILARPTRSLTRYIQTSGRILRPFEGSKRALILDHSGTCKRLGFPTDELELKLCDGKPKKNTAAAKKEKEERLPRKCGACNYMKPAGISVCPACGVKPQRKSDVEVEDGTLQKFERKGATKMNSKEYLATRPQQEVWSGLLRICKPAAASHRFREIYGKWPENLGSKDGPASQELIRWNRSRNIAYRSSTAGGEITSRTRS